LGNARRPVLFLGGDVHRNVWSGRLQQTNGSSSRVVQLLSVNPCRILNVPGGTLRPDRVADITVIAPSATTTVDVSKTRSLSRNSPFHGWTLRGAVAATIVGGRTVYVNDDVQGAEAFGAAAVGA
jgi:dihydroorotase